MRFDLPTWARHLRATAGSWPDPNEPLAAGDLDAPIRAWIAQRSAMARGDDAPDRPGTLDRRDVSGVPDAPDAPDVPGAPGAPDAPDAPSAADPPEAALWWARAGAPVDVAALMERLDPSRRTPSADDGLHGRPDGGMLPRDRASAIEVWTDADLAACHAMWWLAREHANPAWSERLAAVRAWHLEHTQPDNATNRPWAIHVFLLEGSEAGELYAQTLLHNALAMEAEPTPLARALLLDAADALDAAVAAGD